MTLRWTVGAEHVDREAQLSVDEIAERLDRHREAAVRTDPQFPRMRSAPILEDPARSTADPHPAHPDRKREEPQAFVEDAVWFYESNGRDALIEHFNDPDSTDPASVEDQWYGFVTDLDGVVVSHPTFPDNVGMTLHELLGATPEGLVAADELMTATETGKWVDYSYTNPLSGDWETKHTWIVKRDDILIGSGWYEAG